jgi:hypothetical protein
MATYKTADLNSVQSAFTVCYVPAILRGVLIKLGERGEPLVRNKYSLRLTIGVKISEYVSPSSRY